jgi:hypothetical protein
MAIQMLYIQSFAAQTREITKADFHAKTMRTAFMGNNMFTIPLW